MKPQFWPVTIAILVMAGVVQAADLTTAEEVVAFSAEKSAAYKSFSADFTQSMSMMGGTMNVTGHMKFKQPHLMRMDMDMPMMGQNHKMLMVFDAGKIMWQEMEMAGAKRVIKLDFNVISPEAAEAAGVKNPADDMDPKRQWQDAQEKFFFKLIGSDTVHGSPTYVMEGTPKPDAKWSPQETAILQNLGKSRYYVGKDDGFMRKMELYDKAGTTVFMAMEFSNLRFNQDLADDTFKYQPATDVQVVDMSAVMKQMVAPPPAQPSAK